jgi:hypothetical protein
LRLLLLEKLIELDLVLLALGLSLLLLNLLNVNLEWLLLLFRTEFWFLKLNFKQVKNALDGYFILVLFVTERVVVNQAELTHSQTALVASLQEAEFRVVVDLLTALTGHVLDVSLSLLLRREMLKSSVVNDMKRW